MKIDLICRDAEALHALGRTREALDLLHEARPRAEDGAPLLALLLAEGRIRTLDTVNRNADPAPLLALLGEARQLAERLGDRASLADALSLLGQAHYFAELNAAESIQFADDSFAESLDLQQRALSLREELGDARGTSESQFLIGTVYERRQRHDEAMERYEEAYRIADRGAFIREKAEPTRHMAFHCLIEGDLERALPFALKALALREESGFRPHLPLDHLLASEIFMRLDRTEEAWNHANEAYELAERLGIKRAASSSLLLLGDLRAARGETRQAIDDYEQALKLGRELKLPLAVARAAERLRKLRPSGAVTDEVSS
ncbi:tetratricopeptide repeat protein [Cohnella zeiphila]|uniref:Tetratricopeptide repeat protein n=1 Tax=Cohnella zeiphila TaxID=2761120 RepID=A0A7X0ST65_9BACL|nr:tetratricopeptide repeat protein [Cohnella zeiphila]MBB6735650.1 tetratricopeptide repeat protein [Cohnella zeiphila]